MAQSFSEHTPSIPSQWEAQEPAGMVTDLRRGLAVDRFSEQVRSLGITDAQMARVVGLPVRTLARRRKEGRLRPDESDRLWRVERIGALARRLLGEEAGKTWLLRTCPALGGEIPFDLLDTEAGARQIERLLFRLADGIHI